MNIKVFHDLRERYVKTDTKIWTIKEKNYNLTTLKLRTLSQDNVKIKCWWLLKIDDRFRGFITLFSLENKMKIKQQKESEKANCRVGEDICYPYNQQRTSI